MCLDYQTQTASYEVGTWNPTSGVRANNPVYPDGPVATLAATTSTLYAGGMFSTVTPAASQPIPRAGAFALASNQPEVPSAWDPGFPTDVANYYGVNDLFVDADWVYAVGEGAQSGSYMGGTPFAARAATTGAGALDNTWSVDFTNSGQAQYGTAESIARWGNDIAIGGRMLTSTASNDDGYSLLGASTATGAITWTSTQNGRNHTSVLQPDEQRMFVGGSGVFGPDPNTGTGGASLFDTPTAVNAWQPHIWGDLAALVRVGNTVVMGGDLLVEPGAGKAGSPWLYLAFVDVPTDNNGGGGGGGGTGGGGGSTPSTPVTPKPTPAPSPSVTPPVVVVVPRAPLLLPGEVRVRLAGTRLVAQRQTGAQRAWLRITSTAGQTSVPSPARAMTADLGPRWRSGQFGDVVSNGYRPTARVFVRIGGVTLASGVADRNGSVRVRVQMPAVTKAGAVTLAISGRTAAGVLTTQVGLRVTP